MDISLYIEPQTGVILQALQMVQVNAMMHQNSHFPELAHLKDIFLPVGYINTSIFVDAGVANTLISTLFIPKMTASVAGWLLISAGSVCVVVLLVRCIASRQRPTVVEINERTPLISGREPTPSVSEAPAPLQPPSTPEPTNREQTQEVDVLVEAQQPEEV